MMRVERINSVQTAAYQLAMLRPTRMRDRTMNMSGESLLVILFVGLVAGWLAGQIVRGTGFGIVGDLIVGILGAFIGKLAVASAGYPSRYRSDQRNRQRHHRCDIAALHRETFPGWQRMGKQVGWRLVG